MAVPKTAAPELIGQVRGAQRNVRYIPTDAGSGLKQLGAGLKKGSSLTLKGLDMLSGWADEKFRAGYVKNYAEAENEAAKRFMEEVQERRGFDAEGAARRAQQIYAEVGAKYRSRIGGRYQEQFDIAWTRLSGSQNRRAFAFEQRSLREASIETDKALLNKAVEGAASSMDEEAQDGYFGEILDSYNRLYLANNGGRKLPGEVLSEFDKDVDSGFIRTRDGVVLRITDKDEGKGTITRDKVKSIRARWEGRDAQYRKGLERVFDAAHANVIDRLLHEGRTVEADEYLMHIEEKELPISSKVKSKLQDAVIQKENTLLTATAAEAIVSDASALGENPRYNNSEQEARFMKEVAEGGYDAETVALAKQKWVEQKKLRAANLQLDLYNFSKEELQTVDANGKPIPLPLSEQLTKIQAVTDPTLRNSLMEMHKKQVVAQDSARNNSPEYISYMDTALSQFSQDIVRGYYIKDNGEESPLTTKEQQLIRLKSLGFTPKYQALALGYMDRSHKAVSTEEVRRLLSEAGIEVSADSKWIPFMMRELEEARGGQVFNTRSERAKWLEETFTKMLDVEIGRRRKLSGIAEWYDYEPIRTAMDEVKDGDAEWLFDVEGYDAMRDIKARAGSPRALRLFTDKQRSAKQVLLNGGEFSENRKWVYLNPSKKNAKKPDGKAEKPSLWGTIGNALEYEDHHNPEAGF